LKQVKAGQMSRVKARRTIRLARLQVDRARRLLRRLGDTDEAGALRTRFRRLTKHLEHSGLAPEMRNTYGLLTLTMHDLNLLLSQAFYPGGGLTD
jgi:hypothetical protein